ncbi:MAG: glycosyltransferase family 2 protein [Candidatus Abyssobacteria bacterium SURF_5]|uniref:Glycosyltransferase family 2 protein n=1 Tax=Abyssobacteria bacterium (strain SURF_5) TaxID=2093360 RepID=A0A3A4NXE9_ABYX5|nr:MAG: glycosyltransferase family 2 protein [Candidatus Abyssubacteria bacterium SURF_5]
MLEGHKIVVVMPAYNAAKTLKKTYDEVPKQIVDEILLVDDGSHDETIELSRQLGIKTFIHERNFGYGRNQKTCYREALKTGADIVVMLHPDYQYSPKLITAMASLIAAQEYDVVIASRILGVGALKGGMPPYKYIFNRCLTLFENLMLFFKLSEYHTGYRAFSRKVLESLPLLENSDDFLFDNEMLAQVIFWKFKIGEISCPTKYFPEASSINFSRSIKYGFGCVITSLKFRLQKMRLVKFRIFNEGGRRLFEDSYYRVADETSERAGACN